jgi:hypothetical protein
VITEKKILIVDNSEQFLNSTAILYAYSIPDPFVSDMIINNTMTDQQII